MVTAQGKNILEDINWWELFLKSLGPIDKLSPEFAVHRNSPKASALGDSMSFKTPERLFVKHFLEDRLEAQQGEGVRACK